MASPGVEPRRGHDVVPRRHSWSVNLRCIKRDLRRRIACPRTLALADRIVDGANPQEPAPLYFPGDDLFTPFERRRGFPIGNLTSQLFANVYLDGPSRRPHGAGGCATERSGAVMTSEGLPRPGGGEAAVFAPGQDDRGQCRSPDRYEICIGILAYT